MAGDFCRDIGLKNDGGWNACCVRAEQAYAAAVASGEPPALAKIQENSAIFLCDLEYAYCCGFKAAEEAAQALGNAITDFFNTQIGPYTVGQWVTIGLTIYVVVQVLPVLVLAPIGL